MVTSATVDPPHIPVLLRPLLAQCAPIAGTWLDGTFGAGGYTKGLLAQGADLVIGVDRDPGGRIWRQAAHGARHVFRT